MGQLAAVAADVGETAAGAVTQAVITLAHFSEFIGTAVTQILQYGINLAKRLADTVHQIIDLANEITDHTDLSNGQWPQSVKG